MFPNFQGPFGPVGQKGEVSGINVFICPYTLKKSGVDVHLVAESRVNSEVACGYKTKQTSSRLPHLALKTVGPLWTVVHLSDSPAHDPASHSSFNRIN